MINRDLVTSGFDAETLVSERYISYVLLAQIEAGRLVMEFPVVDPGEGLDLTVTIHPPEDRDYRRRYDKDQTVPLPEPMPASFLVVLLPEDEEAYLHFYLGITVTDNHTGMPLGEGGLAGLLMNVELESEPVEGLDGFEKDHALRFSLVRFDDNTRKILEGRGMDPVKVEEKARKYIDRSVPLGVAQSQYVQQIRMRKFVDGEHRSLGFYVNLALRSGPEPNAYLEPRGRLSDAQDFREGDQPIAFATSPGFFDLLGPDLKFREAEETAPGSGEYRYPIRKDPGDPESEVIGRIKGIRVGPEIYPPLPPTGRLMVDMHGEYTDFIGDPDFHLQAFFKPVIEDSVARLEFDEVDVDIGLLGSLLAIAGGIAISLVFGGFGGSSLILVPILWFAVIKGLVEDHFAAKFMEEHKDELSQATFLDAPPFRVPAASRRWDPFYETVHQVAALVDEVTIDSKGVSFAGNAQALDKQPRPVDHTVIRDEERAEDFTVSALRYRVEDFLRITPDLEAHGPGRDRMDFTRTDPETEPTLVTLTNAQITERIKAMRLLAPTTYTAERIYLVGNQIDQILCISRIERGELRRDLIRKFREEKRKLIEEEQGEEIREQVIAELEEELGRPPTEEEIEKAFRKRIEELVDELQPDYEENKLPEELEAAIALALRFDMAPEELIEQQRAGAFILDGKVIVTRRDEDGTITRYYRDKPDSDPRDNLLSLPHYIPPYQPPS